MKQDSKAIANAFQNQIRALLTRTAATAQKMKLTLSEVAALEHIFAHETLTPGELGKKLKLSSGAMTAMVDRLEKVGYVTRQPNPADRRSVLIVASPEMLNARKQSGGNPIMTQVDTIADQFSEKEQVVLLRFIEEITAILNEE